MGLTIMGLALLLMVYLIGLTLVELPTTTKVIGGLFLLALAPFFPILAYPMLAMELVASLQDRATTEVYDCFHFGFFPFLCIVLLHSKKEYLYGLPILLFLIMATRMIGQADVLFFAGISLYRFAYATDVIEETLSLLICYLVCCGMQLVWIGKQKTPQPFFPCIYCVFVGWNVIERMCYE